MYQQIVTPSTQPVITPAQLAAFGRFDVPQQYVTGSSPQTLTADYSLLETFISAATEQVEIMAQTACLQEQVLLTLDFWPNTQDPRNWMQYELSYSFAITPWWWWGFPTKDSIELVRRPVLAPTLSGTPANITAVSVADNVVTVTCSNSFTGGQVVVLAGTAEGNTAEPTLTPSTTPFLNGVPLTILTVSGTQFTAAFNNFYTTGSYGQVVPQSYANASDTGTATVITNPLLVTYYDQLGVLQTWNTTNYTVQYNKICLAVGNWWPLTDRRQDCIQITYWAGNTSTPANVDARLQMAVMFLANHFWENRTIISVEPTSEVGKTLCLMLSSFRTYRIPR
ncbi:MAG: head-tail connector protein [Candidatus Korobacteraceae bacterium]